MSVAALSPVAPEPMITSVTPSSPDGGSTPRLRSEGEEPQLGGDTCRRSRKPPPLHTIADWKVVLHLPEIQTWLRASSHRVTQLTHSVGQDVHGRHVDVHLVQLKDICEDISDHVEQIHALLETEFTLKLLSYSVNIIVDIRTVQLLWHQLRVSVLVLKERLLRSLQDSNGNFTRQTDILQAFSEDQHQTRLDALTEVDDCGQLTIRCSQDYFSLDCGITAFELSDYSPGDEPGGQGAELKTQEASADVEPTPGLNQDPEDPEPSGCCDVAAPGDAPLQAVDLSPQTSPTHPSPPRRSVLLSDGGTEDLAAISRLQAEMSRSTPSLVDAPDRTRFWLELDSVYPDNVSQSCENLQVLNRRNLQTNLSRCTGGPVKPPPEPRSPGATTHTPLLLEEPATQDTTSNQASRTGPEAHVLSEGDSDSSLPSPIRTQYCSSDMEASGEESEPRPPPGKTAVWVLKRQGQKQGAQLQSPEKQHWYGSEEFLALPAQLHKTELLALKLESLAQSLPLGRGDSTQEALQDVDDWDLMEVNPDCDLGQGSSPSPLPQFPCRRNLSHFDSASSSDTTSSLDGSIESGPLSDLQSDEDEGRRSADHYLQLTAPPLGRPGGASLAVQLLEDVQNRDKDPDVWRRIERLVRQLDGFIWWLQDALDSTDNWTQPKQDVDSLRVYLDTHLSFKLNVDGRSSLKESIMEEGSALLSVITSHQSGLKDILQMVSNQWDQLQRQIRRQHSWMLRALRCIQARLLYSHPQSQLAFSAAAANQRPPQPPHSLTAELVSSQYEAQRVALETMAIRLSSLQYPAPANRGPCTQYTRNNSLQQLESDYQELWDWLMDMDAMVTDSHQLMMSEEQRHQLFKSSHVELMLMETKKSSLLRRAEALRKSRHHGNLHHKIHKLTHTWKQLETVLSQQHQPSLLDGPGSSPSPLSNGSPLEQLEAPIKELKVWLRDTELLIFNSCLREQQEASQQLHSFKCLSSEVRARRRGVSSVLKLCQKLLQAGPTAEAGPEAEQHREALQLLSINLERRWEAIVMQALQWQNRLKRELGEQQVPGNFLEAGLADLLAVGPVPPHPLPHPQDDSWEWDETDMSLSELDPLEALEQNRPPGPAAGAPPTLEAPPTPEAPPQAGGTSDRPPSRNVLQVFSLHSVELYRQPPPPWSGPEKQHLLLESLSKDSSSESGIVSDTGDAETTSTSSEAQGGAPQEERDRSPRRDASKPRRARTEEKTEKTWRRDERRRPRRGEGAAEEQPSSPLLSQASSMESILVLDEELFLPRSSSLESCLLPPHTSHAEAGRGGAEGGPSSEELSGRTLDLLKRLENIQTPPPPPASSITRSVSDLTQSSSRRRSLLPASPSLGGSSPGRVPGSSEEEPASLTELSGAEEEVSDRTSTLTQQQHLTVPSSSSRRRCHGNGGAGVEEADAGSVSLLVNVSSTCTDQDEDDSDLLSSSTLTLTDEELHFQEEQGGLSSASSGSEEEEEEEEAEASYVLDYLQTELQTFIRPPRIFSSRADSSLLDELQCGARLSSSTSSSTPRVPGTNRDKCNSLERNQRNQKNLGSRSYVSCLVDDVENANVEQSSSLSKEEDEQLLREESSVFTKRGDASREESYVFRPAQLLPDVPSCSSRPGPPRLELLPSTQRRSSCSSLVGQLKGELPCHSSSLPSPPALSPAEDRRSHHALQDGGWLAAGRTEEVLEEARREVEALPPPRERRSCPPSCCRLLPSPGPAPLKKENVHDFVVEITDMTSTLLRSKGHPEHPGREQAPPLARIRDKVLDHTHRPLLLQGDFYSYLSLSSHDSDCGELTQRATPTPYAPPTPGLETFTSTRRQTSKQLLPPEAPPLSPEEELRDEETLFPACTEEVYLGPPLCYSLAPPRKPRRLLAGGGVSPHAAPSEEAHSHSPSLSSSSGCSSLQEAPPPPSATPPVSSGGGGEHLLCDVVESVSAPAERRRNEAAPYLNPRERPGLMAPPPSNMAAVMTEISVSGSATNPCPPGPAPPTHRNPKSKRSPMRAADMEEEQEDGERRRRRRSRQEAAHTQVSRARRRSLAAPRPPTSGALRRPVVGPGASRLQL